MTEPPLIRRLDAAEMAERLGDLTAILMDAVAHGASVNFMAGITEEEAAAFWRSQCPGVREGGKRLLVAAAILSGPPARVSLGDLGCDVGRWF